MRKTTALTMVLALSLTAGTSALAAGATADDGTNALTRGVSNVADITGLGATASPFPSPTVASPTPGATPYGAVGNFGTYGTTAYDNNYRTTAAADTDMDWGWLGLIGLLGLAGLRGRNDKRERGHH